MSQRTDDVDKAVQKVRDKLDEVASEGKETTRKAVEEVRDAVDDLEKKINNIR